MTVLTTEKNSDLSARVTLTGYAVYAYVEPQDEGTFRVYLDDHLSGDKIEITVATGFDPAVSLAEKALTERAAKDGIDVTGLESASKD